MATRNPQEPFTRISVAEAKAKLDDGSAVMVDVRDPGEYAEVHADGVRLIPVNTVVNEVQQIRDYAGNKEVMFICRSGQRSALAAEFAVAGGSPTSSCTTWKVAHSPGSRPVCRLATRTPRIQ